MDKRAPNLPLVGQSRCPAPKTKVPDTPQPKTRGQHDSIACRQALWHHLRHRRVTHAISAFFVLCPQVLFTKSLSAKSNSRPNIVLILADDLGYGEIHALNPQRGRIPTPHLDQLVTSGVTFTDAHSASSVCTPSRYALLTGRYCWRTRLQKGVLTGGDPLIAADRPTLQAMLQDHGYQTAVIGKWHLNYNYDGTHRQRRPQDKQTESLPCPFPIGTRIVDGPIARGFDFYFGFHHSREMSSLCENDRIIAEIPVVEMLPRLTQRAVEYINQQSKTAEPFFLYLPLNAPHTPIAPSKRWIGKSGLGRYGDFVMQMDASVGEVVKAIDDRGLTSNTLIIFSSDNGTSKAAGIEKLQQLGHYPSAHFRGSKADLWEGGHRVPLIVRWPGGAGEPNTIDETLVCLSDLYATIAELIGAEILDHAAVDSVSFRAALSGRPVRNPRTSIVHHSISGHFAIRRGKWKLNLRAAPVAGAPQTSSKRGAKDCPIDSCMTSMTTHQKQTT